MQDSLPDFNMTTKSLGERIKCWDNLPDEIRTIAKFNQWFPLSPLLHIYNDTDIVTIHELINDGDEVTRMISVEGIFTPHAFSKVRVYNEDYWAIIKVSPTAKTVIVYDKYKTPIKFYKSRSSLEKEGFAWPVIERLFKTKGLYKNCYYSYDGQSTF